MSKNHPDLDRELRRVVLERTGGQPATVSITWISQDGQLSNWFERVDSEEPYWDEEA